MESKFIYGVDFGTSNSAISVIDTTTNEIVYHFIDGSLIFFPDQTELPNIHPLEYFVGQQAKIKYAESQMNGRFMKSLKKLLGQSNLGLANVYRRPYSIEELVSLILKYLKQHADEFVGENITRAVFGRPVVFDEKTVNDQLAQKRLLKAAKLAGFEEVAFQLEPIAAAFTYERTLAKNELVLVADFGGGTSDFTLMELGPQKWNQSNRKSDIINNDGIYVGGDSFDYSMMWNKVSPHFGRGLTYLDYNNYLEIPRYFYVKMCDWQKMEYFEAADIRKKLDFFYRMTNYNKRFHNLIKLVDNNLGFAIFQEAEQAKIRLSQQDNTSINFDIKEINFTQEVNIEEFSQKIIGRDVAKIKRTLASFLETNNVIPSDIETVFMTGGSSLVRPVRELMIDFFGENALSSGDNFNSVSYGLGYSYGMFYGNEEFMN